MDERNGEDGFVRAKAGGVQGVKRQRNLILFTWWLHGTVFTVGQRSVSVSVSEE